MDFSLADENASNANPLIVTFNHTEKVESLCDSSAGPACHASLLEIYTSGVGVSAGGSLQRKG